MHSINKILVIEDNPSDAILLKESLNDISYSQLVTIPGISQLQDYKGSLPELIFLDLNLPDSRGMESFMTVNRQFPDAAIIVLSGMHDEKMALQALQAGAQDYLVKGEFDEKSLSKSIRYSIERKRSQISLKEREEQYRVLVENAPEALVVIDMETGKFTSVSQSAVTLFKVPAERLLQLGVPDISPPFQPDGRPSAESAVEKIQMAIQGGKPHFEWMHIDSDGREIPCEVWLVRIPSAGKVLIRGSVLDISERKKAEMEIRALEETRRLIMNSALDAIVGMDTRGRISIWTPRAEQIFGWKEKEVLGKLVAETIIPEKYREKHLQGLRRYMDTRQAVILNKLVEITAITKEGKEFPVELTVAEINNDGENFFCAFIRDITERVHAQRQIVKEKKLSDSIIESLPGLFCLFDINGQCIRWNKQTELLSGYSGEEIGDMKPLEFFNEADRPVIRAHAMVALKTGETKLEADLRTRSGDSIPFYFSGIAIEYEGKPCIIGTGIDISDRKKAEEMLLQTTERLRELSAHLQNVREDERIRIAREIHDELGQQLTVLKMDISWLKRKVEIKDPKVEQKMKDLMAVIDNTVKTVRKISSDLRPSLLDDLGLVAALEWHSQEFEKRSGIKTTFVSAIPEVAVETPVATAMFRIFQETLTNVARHADATTVEATLIQENGKLIMRIRDNGKGFSIDDIENKRTLGILGMQERIAIIDGEYRIDSQPGQGTLVEVKVPTGTHSKEKVLL